MRMREFICVLQRNGHGIACKLREFALGGNGHGPVEQIDEVNIPNSATGHENERVYMCFSNEACLLFFWVKFSIVHLYCGFVWILFRTSAKNENESVEGLLSLSKPDLKLVCCHQSILIQNKFAVI